MTNRRPCTGGCGRILVPGATDSSLPTELAANHARGACQSCYNRARYTGDLIDLPRRLRTSDEVQAEWDRFYDRERSLASNFRTLAPRLGMTAGALEMWYRRRKARGLVAA